MIAVYTLVLGFAHFREVSDKSFIFWLYRVEGVESEDIHFAGSTVKETTLPSVSLWCPEGRAPRQQTYLRRHQPKKFRA